MSEKIRNKHGMWTYLESIGVLEKGTEEDIKKAKREYQRLYIREYKRRERRSHSEYIILLSNPKGEHKAIAEAAKEHKTSVTRFIKTAALAYLNKTYVVPDKEQVASFEVILSECRNEIQKIAKNTMLPIAERIHQIERRIEKMEASIDALFRHPQESP